MMTKRVPQFRVLTGICGLLLLGCASQIGGARNPPPTQEGTFPEASIQSVGGVTLGEPIAVTLDFDGNPLVANGIPGRVVHLAISRDEAIEFQPPPSPGFYPTDLQPTGFFVYVIDQVERRLLRFYRTGAYLDVLIDFEDIFQGRRVSPVGLDVDGSGRIAVTDVKNHAVIIFNTYLDVELVLGSFGKFAGQFDAPEGVFFTPGNGLLVADSGNRRIQLFDAEGGFVKIVPEVSAPNPLRRPRRAVMDRSQKIYVADPLAGRVFVFDPSGQLIRSIVPRGVEEFRPTDLAIAPSGLMYVTDSANNTLYLFR
ncbi:MAG: NHL repeat-containing protein [Candidatus Krumholzibacteria bacterium]|nr:NHL repeat-containing protein [Candidatus Krumholzibacteria bacterium]